jgi:tRNA (guanine-N7-)-methyltransferase
MSAPLWRAVFGNERPVEIEIGPGRGDVLLAYAAADPTTNFYGIEIRRAQAAALNARAGSLGLANVFVLAADARCVVRHFVPAASVTAYHVYFPDPWPKTRHRARRLFAPPLAPALARTLVAGGRVHLASDLASVFDAACAALERAGFVPTSDDDGRPRPITKFERKYAAGRTHARVYRRRQARRPQADAGSPSPQKTS